MQAPIIEYLTLLNTSIGISRTALKIKLQKSESQLNQLFKLLDDYEIKINQLNDGIEATYQLKQTPIPKRFCFNFSEILFLCQIDVYSKLNQSIKLKLHAIIGPSILNLLHDNKIINSTFQFSIDDTYEFLYFSRKSNSFEKRLVTPVKELRIGSQMLLEAYCFKRKAIRWFELGRIKKAKILNSFTPIPKTARSYFKQSVIQCGKKDLPYLKWAFHDIIIAYNQYQLKIRFSEKENILKELAHLKNSYLLNNHSN